MTQALYQLPAPLVRITVLEFSQLVQVRGGLVHAMWWLPCGLPISQCWTYDDALAAAIRGVWLSDDAHTQRNRGVCVATEVGFVYIETHREAIAA